MGKLELETQQILETNNGVIICDLQERERINKNLEELIDKLDVCVNEKNEDLFLDCYDSILTVLQLNADKLHPEIIKKAKEKLFYYSSLYIWETSGVERRWNTGPEEINGISGGDIY